MSVKDRLLKFIQFKGIAVSVFEKECSLSNGYINKTKSVSADMCSQILSAYPDLSAEWLLRDKGGMLSQPVTSIQVTDAENNDLVPELPIDAAAGFTDDMQLGITPAMCNMRQRIPGLPKYDLTISVRGDSMDPTFASGDRLAIRRCYDIVEWGAPHVLDTTEGVYVKRIKEDAQSIICISDNADYPQFNIPKTCIRGIYKVVALLRVC